MFSREEEAANLVNANALNNREKRQTQLPDLTKAVYNVFYAMETVLAAGPTVADDLFITLSNALNDTKSLNATFVETSYEVYRGFMDEFIDNLDSISKYWSCGVYLQQQQQEQQQQQFF